MKSFITLLFAILFSFWTIRLYYKLYDKKTKRYIFFIGILIVFWMLIRIIKSLVNSAFIERICWYMYYLPLIFIPLLYYICSSSLLGKLNNKKKFLIYLISSLLFLLVITNDFHELVFSFNKGLLLYDDYNHCIGYYLICIWIFYLFGKGLIDLGIYRMKTKKDMKGFLPFIVILLGLLYTIFYVIDIPYIRSINMSIVNSALICIGIELAFYLDLIPNNSKYKSWFSNSNLDMAIISYDGKTKYTTAVLKTIPDFLLKDIKHGLVNNTYSDGNILYEVKKNKDSYVIFRKDLTNINNLMDEVKRQRKELLKQQDSIKFEEKTKKELYEMRIRKDVIDKVELKLSMKKNEARNLLLKDNVSYDDLSKVKRIIIYSKKKSMLMISSINGDVYNEEGIKILLDELLVSMSSANIKGFVRVNDKMIINGNTMSLLYDILYDVIECNNGKSIMVFVSFSESVKMKIIVNTNIYFSNKIKTDSNVSVSERKYDNDIEVEFVIRDGVL